MGLFVDWGGSISWASPNGPQEWPGTEFKIDMEEREESDLLDTTCYVLSSGSGHGELTSS